MAHFVFRTDDGQFVGTRRATDPLGYNARTTVTTDLREARVFNTKSAATNAGRSAKLIGNAETVELSMVCRGGSK